MDQWLHSIPHFGWVVFLRHKEKFLKEVEGLTASVQKFAEQVRHQIQQLIDKARTDLQEALMPALTKQPPEQWIRSSGQPPEEPAIRRFLERDLTRAFGTAEGLVREMKVRVAFKGVTYELLRDPEFRKAATKAIPELGERLHHEFEAVKAASDGTGL